MDSIIEGVKINVFIYYRGISLIQEYHQITSSETCPWSVLNIISFVIIFREEHWTAADIYKTKTLVLATKAVQQQTSIEDKKALSKQKPADFHKLCLYAQNVHYLIHINLSTSQP